MNHLSNHIFRAIIFSFLLLTISCSDTEKSEGSFCTPCLVEIDGTYTEVDLDKEPEYLTSDYEGIINELIQEMKYPFEARQNGVEGDVHVSFIIRKDGTVDSIEILEDPGSGLGETVISAMNLILEGVCFSPAELDGEPVDVKTQLVVKFRLEG